MGWGGGTPSPRYLGVASASDDHGNRQVRLDEDRRQRVRHDVAEHLRHSPAPSTRAAMTYPELRCTSTRSPINRPNPGTKPIDISAIAWLTRDPSVPGSP